jgi:hypothetical protein
LFFFAIAWLLAERRATPPWFLAACAVLALTMTIGDVLENRQLLLLSQISDPASMADPLARLRVFTLAKWSAIFVTSALLASLVWRDASLWRWSAVAFGLAALFGLLGVRDLAWFEPGANAVGVAWLLTWVHSLRARVAPPL